MKFRKQHPIYKRRDHTFNPFLYGDPDMLASIVIGMLPERPNYTPEEELKFEQERKEGEARYKEQRYGTLPPDTYRILDQGGICGWSYELEINNRIILLEEPNIPGSSIRVHHDKKRADEIARTHVAKKYGDDAAARAKFVVVWGGCL